MTHNQQIIKFLMPPGRRINAEKFYRMTRSHCLRSRISDIKKMNYTVISEIVCNKKTKTHYAEYFFQ